MSCFRVGTFIYIHAEYFRSNFWPSRAFEYSSLGIPHREPQARQRFFHMDRHSRRNVFREEGQRKFFEGHCHDPARFLLHVTVGNLSEVTRQLTPMTAWLARQKARETGFELFFKSRIS